MTAIGSPESLSGRNNRNHWIEIAPCLRDHISQALVMGIGEITLERRGLDRINRQNCKQYGMTTEGFLVAGDEMTTYLLDHCRGISSGSVEFVEDGFARRQAFGAGLRLSRATFSWSAFDH